MKTKKLLATSVIFTLLTLSLVSAFGVSSPYWETNPLNMAKGEVRIVNLNVQNMVGDDDVNVQAKLVEGQDITSLDDAIYTVEAKTANTFVPLTIKMPRDAVTGETTTVKVEFKTVNLETGGIAMGTGMTILFDVVATDQVADSNMGMTITIVIAIIVLAIILWLLMKKKK